MNREQAKQEIKQYIKCTEFLEKSKGNMFCCPFSDCNSGHNKNRTGAVKYFENTNTWFCYACDRGGDIIDLYMKQNNCDYNAALNDLAERTGLTIDNRQAATQEPQNAAQSDEKAKQDKYPNEEGKRAQNADYNEYYYMCHNSINDAALSYLTARGISNETIAFFNIGYDPLSDPAREPGAMGNVFKPHPTPRIIVPCTDDFYIARSIDPATPAAFKAPNPKGSCTQLFNTAALYNNAEIVFVTEGVFDALSFIEAGQAAIATNGKGNGKLLIKQLQEKSSQANFVIVPDNDSDPKTAAQTKAQAEKFNKDLQAIGYNSIIYNVAGEYHDANDAMTKDRAAFEKNIAAAVKAMHKEINRDELTDFTDKIQTEAYKPYRTGLRFFDDLLGGGILSQSLLLLLAAPATGKTTLCAQIAELMAEKQHKPFIYFNLEMSREQMLAKAISTKLWHKDCYKSAKQILQGYDWTDSDREIILQTIEEYRRNVYPYLKYNPDDIGSNLETMLEYLNTIGEQAAAKEEPAPAVVVDYLHKLSSSKQNDVAETIKAAVDGLKQYAIRFDTFVITIGAVNRESMKNGKISVHSGRDSSGIEYEGDYILTMNYVELDNGTVKVDSEEHQALKFNDKKQMILRLEKGRLDRQAVQTKTMFDAPRNTFYGMDFEEIENAPPFEEDEEEQTTIII